MYGQIAEGNDYHRREENERAIRNAARWAKRDAANRREWERRTIAAVKSGRYDVAINILTDLAAGRF